MLELRSVVAVSKGSAGAGRASRALRTETDPRWQAVLARDVSRDGEFYFAVATTGIYCRPSCAARRARPENVTFFATPAVAEAAGFRPCERCRPSDAPAHRRRAAKIAEVCRTLATASEMPTLAELARSAGMSPYHFHRTFKAVTGVTPRAYAAARRAERVRTELGRADGSVTAALYDAGFGSSGRFYATADVTLGMTPSAYRAGGADVDIRYAVGECSLGSILVATGRRGVCAIAIGDDPAALARDLRQRFPRADLAKGDATFAALVARVIASVESPRLGLDLPLDLRGTVFQQRVWRELSAIPLGTTATYSEIASRIGAPRAARGVAAACAANPVAVAIPCHRVVRRDGDPAGYRWGIERKRALLEREASAAAGPTHEVVVEKGAHEVEHDGVGREQ